jgi:hypothetical protein
MSGCGYDFRFGQIETLRTRQHAPSGLGMPYLPGWEGLDFVPCTFGSLLTLTRNDTDQVIETAKHSCTLPNCDTLKWDKAL